mgnify:CR=1 FL=1
MIKGENEFMTDVLFYQNYTYVADISAIVLCIICWLLLHSSYAVREKSLVIFKAGTVCLMMATVCGARAQGRSAECGVIELGMDADLILLDFNQPHLIPCHNVLSQLVYAASGHDVALTMVRGKILYADGKYPTLDIAGALKELHDYAIPRVFSDEPEAQA